VLMRKKLCCCCSTLGVLRVRGCTHQIEEGAEEVVGGRHVNHRAESARHEEEDASHGRRVRAGEVCCCW
jgi:hypothetical protein